jgi:hypothetical protein
LQETFTPCILKNALVNALKTMEQTEITIGEYNKLIDETQQYFNMANLWKDKYFDVVKSLKINWKRIILETLFFAVITSIISFAIATKWGVC